MAGKLFTVLLIVGALGGGAAVSYVGNNPDSMDTLMAMRPSWSQPQAPYKRTKYYAQCRRDFAVSLRRYDTAGQQKACECFDREFSRWPEDMRRAASTGRFIAMLPTMMAERPTTGVRKPSKNDIQNMKMQEKTRQSQYKEEFSNGLEVNPLSSTAMMFKVQALLRTCRVM